MGIKILLGLLMGLTSASCANMGRITDMMIPEPLSKEELKGMAYETTPQYGFKVGISDAVEYGPDDIPETVDEQFAQFSECFDIKDGGETAAGYMIAVVGGTFQCPYHGGRCNGEYDPEGSVIIVSYKAFNRQGILPLLKHEWAHAYGILLQDHSNLDHVQECTRY